MIPQANPLLPPGKPVDQGIPRSYLIITKPLVPISISSMSSFKQKQTENNIIKTANSTKQNKTKMVYRRITTQKYNFIPRSQKKFINSIFIDLKAIKQQFQYDMIGTQGYLIQGSIRFNSKFQSGNLLRVQKVNNFQYDLTLQNDINTKGNPQWFYYNIQCQQPTNICLNIINMGKKRSMFQSGMQPFVYRKNWIRATSFQINYQQSKKRKQHSSNFYSSLKMKLQLPKGITGFAYSIPYTIQRCQQLIKKVSKYFTQQLLSSSIAKRQIKILTGGDKKQPIVWVIARQHPGQSPGSLLFQGFLNSILQEPSCLNSYCFKLVPMVNPDGVAIGNYRTNLAGLDLNRKWNNPSKESTPQILALKQLIMQYKDQIAFFIDCHAHSRRKGTFFYGAQSKTKDLCPQVLPYLLSKIDNRYQLNNCTFTVNPSKLCTARAIISKQIKGFTYTIQTSFYGNQNQNGQVHPFQQKDYLQMGASLFKGILQMRNYTLVKRFNYVKETSQQFMKSYKAITKLQKQLKQKKPHYQQDSGSDSNPQQGQLGRREREDIIQKKQKQKGIFLISKNIVNQPFGDMYRQKQKQKQKNKLLFQNRYSSFRSKIQDIYMKRFRHQSINDQFQQSFIQQKIHSKSLKYNQTITQKYLKERNHNQIQAAKKLQKQLLQDKSSIVSQRFKNVFRDLKIKNQQLEYRIKKINIIQY